MEKKKYYYNALAHRLQTYPDTNHFRMFVGQCYIYEVGRSSLLDEIVRFYYATKFTQSEREHLIKKYDEYMIVSMLNGWEGMKQRGFTPERINYLYDKVKYKKVMRLNIGFNEVDFKWQIMAKVFDAIFTNAPQEELKTRMIELNEDLKNNILLFSSTVKEVMRLVGKHV